LDEHSSLDETWHLKWIELQCCVDIYGWIVGAEPQWFGEASFEDANVEIAGAEPSGEH